MSLEVDSADGSEALAAAMRAKRLQGLVQGRREYLGLSQEDVAGRLTMSSRAYGNWERGVVREWTDHKLYALAEALEMTPYQTARLFWIAVGRTPQPEFAIAGRHDLGECPATAAFLDDYFVMMNALSLPAFLIDHRWDVKKANSAYRDLFHGVRRHHDAMPAGNFLRFGLFHPDAPHILAKHADWMLSMLAQLAASLERHDQDPVLQAIRRDVYRDPALREAYVNELPGWVLGAGADLIHHGDGVRLLRHPDPEVGLRECRLIEETPRPLQALSLTRITLVLTDADDADAGERRPCHDHHAA
ncbi:helix-turn-helix domain-containing protein [Streptomyces sp. NPDC047082]|uniref:helix-turn-helix domain-containing protein n=1 Tax=Streptomyces sp. NPDC047082 TaxID=3155259 RepID=UPI00340F27B3